MASQNFYHPTDLNYYNSQVSDDEYFKNLSPGYVFHPSDSQLIVDYLIPKIKNEKLPRNLIKVVNCIFDLDPENLQDEYGVNRAEEWLFFTPRDRRSEREEELAPLAVAANGYWKVEGDDEIIQHKGETVGFRRTLEFHKGCPPNGRKTPWIMHQLRTNNDSPTLQQSVADETKLDDWVVYRIYREDNRWKEKEETLGEEPEICYSNGSRDV